MSGPRLCSICNVAITNEAAAFHPDGPADVAGTMRYCHMSCAHRFKAARVARQTRLEQHAGEMLAILKSLVADWESVPESAPVPDEINNDDHWAAAHAIITLVEDYHNG